MGFLKFYKILFAILYEGTLKSWGSTPSSKFKK